MSLRPLVRNSPDLSRLVNEGYAVRIQSGYLLIDDVPFVTSEKRAHRGTMACPLDTQGDSAVKPATHVMWFAGGVPCDKHGTELAVLIHARDRVELAEGVVADCSFSQKPSPQGYANYYDKVITYVGLVIGHAQALEPGVTAATFRPVVTDEEDSVFRYVDSASSRAGITAHTDKLALRKVAIVGLEEQAPTSSTFSPSSRSHSCTCMTGTSSQLTTPSAHRARPASRNSERAS